jgi:hypothetical protein
MTPMPACSITASPRQKRSKSPGTSCPDAPPCRLAGPARLEVGLARGGPRAGRPRAITHIPGTERPHRSAADTWNSRGPDCCFRVRLSHKSGSARFRCRSRQRCNLAGRQITPATSSGAARGAVAEAGRRLLIGRLVFSKGRVFVRQPRVIPQLWRAGLRDFHPAPRRQLLYSGPAFSQDGAIGRHFAAHPAAGCRAHVGAACCTSRVRLPQTLPLRRPRRA